jgi:hypothetical protein
MVLIFLEDLNFRGPRFLRCRKSGYLKGRIGARDVADSGPRRPGTVEHDARPWRVQVF